MKIEATRIKVIESDRPVKAFADLILDDCFAIHGVRVIKGKDEELHVSMPYERREKDGEIKYFDICHPITTDFRTEITKVILDAYEKAKAKA